MNLLLKFSVIILLGMSSLSIAEQSISFVKKAETVKSAPLLSTPSNSSERIKLLPKKQRLNVFERKRAWYRVSSSDLFEGWVKMLNIRLLGRVKREGELGVVSLLDSISTIKSKPTTSTGIRGFDEEDLMNAKANIEQVVLLDHFTSDESELRRFLVIGQLNARHINNIFEEGSDE